MEFFRPKWSDTPEEDEPSAEELPPLLLTPELAFNGDFENISSPEEFIAAVDFTVLNTIFDEMIAKSGGEGEVQNSGHKIDPSKISFKKDLKEIPAEGKVVGRAIVERGEIELVWDYPEHSRVRPEKIIKLLATLAHEATHVRGSYVHEIVESPSGVTVKGSDDAILKLEMKTGVEEIQGSSTLPGSYTYSYSYSGTSLNEAITENIALEVLREYLLRTGNSGYLADKHTHTEMGSGIYILERLAFNAVVSAFAEELHLSKEEVWRAFVHAYLRGNIEVLDMMREFGKILSTTPEIDLLAKALTLDISLTVIGISTDSILEAVASLGGHEEIKDRLSALGKRVRILNSVEFKNIALKDALGLRG